MGSAAENHRPLPNFSFLGVPVLDADAVSRELTGGEWQGVAFDTEMFWRVSFLWGLS